MNRDQDSYNIAVIRKLLQSAFTPDELRRFCRDRSQFYPLLIKFSPNDNLEQLVERVIEYCCGYGLINELLTEVRLVNPAQYARFEPHLVTFAVHGTVQVTPEHEQGNELPQPTRARAVRWLVLVVSAFVVITALLAVIAVVRRGEGDKEKGALGPGQVATTGISIQTRAASATPIATAGRMQAEVTQVWDDGAVIVYVPEGTFLMGSADIDSAAEEDEKPQHRVYLNAFWIDQTEVTNAEYRRCVAAGVCTPPSETGSMTRPDYYANPDFDDYPVIWITWEQANSYCAWAGKRLPTEAEWEKAARGVDGWLYPWGNDVPNCDRANYDGRSGAGFCVGDTMKVGSYPTGASPYGALDMTGNVREWVADWYQKDYYVESPEGNPTGPDAGEERVVRGGSWYYGQHFARAAARVSVSPTRTGNGVGFRCARSDQDP